MHTGDSPKNNEQEVEEKKRRPLFRNPGLDKPLLSMAQLQIPKNSRIRVRLLYEDQPTHLIKSMILVLQSFLPYLIRVWELGSQSQVLISSLHTYRIGYSSTCMWIIDQ